MPAVGRSRPSRRQEVWVPIHEVAAEGFEQGAVDYERARPGYPQDAVDHLVDVLPIRSRSRVLDLAAGTGKFTRLLDSTGADIVAIEPVAAMRRQLSVSLPGVQVLDGTAEAIPLPDESVDAVTVAQGFHWFDFAPALVEIRRVLKPQGGLALLWNKRDDSVPWVAEMSEVIRWHEFLGSSYETTEWEPVIAADGGFTEAGHVSFSWVHPLSFEMLKARVRSVSYIATKPPEEQEALAEAVVDLVREQPEPVDLPYTTHVYWAHKL
jgi:ubiquinone/menaquinone biosynthesis C-methylase UbiE